MVLDNKPKTNTHWSVVFITLVFLNIFLLYLNANEHFTEYFGSTCIDFIPFKSPVKIDTKPNKIFVSIASYRDDECQQTLKSIFDNADNPFNIIVGTCQQNKEDTEKCELGLDPKYKKQIKDISMDYMKAKGPTYARYWCSTLWDGEEFFLQIDSHTHFNKHWDTDIINMYRQCKLDSNKPILSSYPATEKQIKLDGYPEMCNGKLNNDKIPTFLAGWTNNEEISYNGEPKEYKPKRSPKPFAAGGFMFLNGNFLDEIPYDPNLSHLFQGEETLLSARLWTHGYDFYTPNTKVAWHHYGRLEKPKYWTDHKDSSECRIKAEKRVLFLLGIEKESSIVDKDFIRDLHSYGFGKFRNLEDYWLASGIDFSKKEDDGLCSDCNNKTNPDPKFDGWNFKKDGFKKIKKFM
jgi:hypothetical protein